MGSQRIRQDWATELTDWKGKYLLFSEKVGPFSSQSAPSASMYFPPFVIARETEWHNLDYEMWGTESCPGDLYSLKKSESLTRRFISCPGHSSHILHFLLEVSCDFWSLKLSWGHKAIGIRLQSQHAKLIISFFCLTSHLEITVDYTCKLLFPCSEVCKLSLALLGSFETGWVWLQVGC